MFMLRNPALKLSAALFGAVCIGDFASAQEAPMAEMVTESELQIRTEMMAEQKAVYATVESMDLVTARARIGGTVATLKVDEGDEVGTAAEVAVIVDDRLVPQVRALDARVASLMAEASQAAVDRDRAKQLLEKGVVAQSRFDDAQTRVNIVQGQLDAVRQERSLVVQQQREGVVLAPTAGIVLDVLITEGSVVVAGESVATIASKDYVLRLRLPERHAQFLNTGDEVRLEPGVLAQSASETGIIRKVYPQIADGRVVADVVVEGLSGYFVGERILVWVTTSERPAILVPPAFLVTSYGVDYVVLLSTDGQKRRVPVQRGRSRDEGRIEIISGLGDGDVIVTP